ALGTPPIGVHDWGNRDFTPYIDSSEVASVGTPSGPNYEAMLELEPDLIIGRAEQIAWFGDNALENLQSIAPVVLSDSESSSWEGGLLLHGAVVGQEDVAQDMLETYETRLTEFQDVIADQGDMTIAIIRSRADAFNIYASNY